MDMVVISSAKFIKKQQQQQPSIYLAPSFNSCSQKVRWASSVVAVVTYKDACKMVLQAEGLVCPSAHKQHIIQIPCVYVYMFSMRA